MDWRAKVDDLLMQALELEGAARSDFVGAIEAPNLRESVCELLQLCESDDDSLELDPAAIAGLLEAAAEHLPGDFESKAAFSLEPPQLPDRIGAWRVLDRIGAGGMGEVLKVERSAGDFEQLGALKLIRSGFAAGEFKRRFLQERQILARLGHPGIAGLLDGGTDVQGHPYLVMEFVDGEQIDRHCDSHRLTLEARIDLFVEVCRAVAHAHRNLVVHRDLKPSNILVRADGQVKLLDFGIAKVLGGEHADELLATRLEQRLFTPEYASPEQVRGLSITTASDVYQLGLLLYELLCGQRAQLLGKLSPAGVERSICESELPRPSQRVTGSDDVAGRRRLQPKQLTRRLRGDLDTIVGKALQKKPDRRYGTVDELIDDLARLRSGHALRARPDTFGYRSARFVRRHPIGLGFALVTAALLGLYLATLTLQARALQRERDRAQAEASKAKQVQTLVQRLFEGIDPEISGGEPLSVRALLDRSFAQIEGELGEHPEVQAELLLTVGDVYQALGDYRRADQLLSQAAEVAEPLQAEQPLLAARIYRSLGRSKGQGNALEASENWMQRSLDLLRAQSPDQPLQTAATLFHFADMLRRLGAAERALAASRESLALRRANSADALDLASSLIQLSLIEQSLNVRSAAVDQLRESIELMLPRLGEGHPRVAETRAELARLLRQQGQLDEAETLYLQAIDSLGQSRGLAHPLLGIVLGNYGNLLLSRGDTEAAEATYRRALSIHMQSFGHVHARVALTYNWLGMVQEKRGEIALAIESYRNSLQALPPTHAVHAPAVRRNLANAYLRIDKPELALQSLDLIQTDTQTETDEAALSTALLRILALQAADRIEAIPELAQAALEASSALSAKSLKRLQLHRALAAALHKQASNESLQTVLGAWQAELDQSELPAAERDRSAAELTRLLRGGPGAL